MYVSQNFHLDELVPLLPGKNLLAGAAVKFQIDKSLKYTFHLLF